MSVRVFVITMFALLAEQTLLAKVILRFVPMTSIHDWLPAHGLRCPAAAFVRS
jgi:hypothetical protein